MAILYKRLCGAPSESAKDVARLQPDERAAYMRLRRPDDRRAYLASHVLLRSGLEGFGLPFDTPLERSTAGQPRTICDEVFFSLSRTRRVVACAFAEKGPIGLDVECAERVGDPCSLASEIMSRAERQRFSAVPKEAQTNYVLRTFVRKEAILKAIGTGFLIHPRLVELDIDLCTAAFQGEWHFFDSRLEDGVVCSLAISASEPLPSVSFHKIHDTCCSGVDRDV